MDLKEADILGDGIGDHWYYSSKSNAVGRLLGHRQYHTVLDVGAGSGFFAKQLLAQSHADEAWCVDTSYAGDSDSKEGEKPVYFRTSVAETNANLILLMDVLEHVDDDIGLLREYVNKANVGTTFLISVPAFQFLWSEHDIFLAHKRRYTLRQIEQAAAQAGLEISLGCYYFAATLPFAAVTRLPAKILRGKPTRPRSQLRQHHPVLNRILQTLSRWELAVMPHNRCMGLTAFCLAVKAQETDSKQAQQ